MLRATTLSPALKRGAVVTWARVDAPVLIAIATMSFGKAGITCPLSWRVQPCVAQAPHGSPPLSCREGLQWHGANAGKTASSGTLPAPSVRSHGGFRPRGTDRP